MDAVHLVHDVAEKTGLDEEICQRVLDALHSFGVIDSDDVEEYETDAADELGDLDDDDDDSFDDDELDDRWPSDNDDDEG